MKRISTFGARALMTLALLVMTAVSAMAVNVTYRLTTHIDGRTLTATVQQNPGTAPNLPKDMKRGFTEYLYYDETRTTTVSAIPNEEECIIEVGYVFRPPFVLSDETDQIPYNVSISNGRGYIHLDNNGKMHCYPTEGVRHKIYFYGDCYCLWVVNNEGEYITWTADQSSRTTVSAAPQVGWQLLENLHIFYAELVKHFSLGTYVANQNAPGTYMYAQKNMNASATSNENKTATASILDNENRFIDNSGNFGSDASLPYSMFVYSAEEGSSEQYPFVITYYILRGYPPYGIKDYFTLPLRTAVDVEQPGRGKSTGANDSDQKILDALDSRRDIENYDYAYYHDVQMTQKYGIAGASYNQSNPWMCEPGPTISSGFYGKNAIPANLDHNVVVWVLETIKDEATISDRWTTIMLPFSVTEEQLQDIGNILVNEFDHVEGSGDSYNLKFKAVTQMNSYTPYLIKATDANAVAYGKLFASEAGEGGESRIDKIATQGTTVSMVGTLANKKLTYQDDNPYLFFMGYKTADDLNETPKFYHVVNNNRTIGARHAWFEIKDPNASSGARSLSIVSETETGIQEIVNPDGTSYPVANIYNVKGQLIRANATSTDGLPKGIYIIGGRKLIVK